MPPASKRPRRTMTDMAEPNHFNALGKRQTTFTGLDVFDRPEHVVEVTLTGDQLTAFCPVTRQPDFYRYRVHYRPQKVCIRAAPEERVAGDAIAIVVEPSDVVGWRPAVVLEEPLRLGLGGAVVTLGVARAGRDRHWCRRDEAKDQGE